MTASAALSRSSPRLSRRVRSLACSLSVTHCGELVAHKALGRFTYEPSSPPVSEHTIFDLASVTKVVATTAMAMILYERGVLDLEAPVTAVVPEFASGDARRRAVTLRMLLAHSSGLPAYKKLFLRARTPDEMLQAAFVTALSADPGARAEYSDIGFIILGVALERLADEALDSFCQREVFGPLAMSHTTFNPAKELREEIPPTADDRTFPSSRHAGRGAGRKCERAGRRSRPCGIVLERGGSRPLCAMRC